MLTRIVSLDGVLFTGGRNEGQLTKDNLCKTMVTSQTPVTSAFICLTEFVLWELAPCKLRFTRSVGPSAVEMHYMSLASPAQQYCKYVIIVIQTYS